MSKSKNSKDYFAALQRLASSTDSCGPPPNRPQESWDLLSSIDERVQMIIGIANNQQRKSTNMLFFVMYDIENNKVRRYIVKYLEKKGCTRIQKSIFLADLPMEKYQDIRYDLTQVQAAYDNEDSILVVPITTDYLKAMKVIGQNINMDIITHTRNTLFF